jgi:hypothetical protein
MIAARAIASVSDQGCAFAVRNVRLQPEDAALAQSPGRNRRHTEVVRKISSAADCVMECVCHDCDCVQPIHWWLAALLTALLMIPLLRIKTLDHMIT